MNTTMITTTPVPAVRFGDTHGYRFVGDAVELNATFAIANRSAHDRSWALQLWACPSVPTRTDDLVGHLVAEAPLPPITEIAGEAEAFAVTAPAQPPAGDRDHSMVLVLVARRGGDGAFDEVHDVTSFPERERFLLPRLAGPVSYRVEGERVRLEIAAIENPRDAANISGTLSLELWALKAPYSSSNFHGAPLAGAVLGTLAGQDRWTALALDLPYTAPTAGQTHVVVMVREWTGAGYTTRDFANLGTLPVAKMVAAPAPQPVASALAPSPIPAAPVVATTTATPAASAAAKAPAPAAVAPVAATRAPEPTAPTAKPATPGKIALNTATLEQLLTVKGLPRAVAERILRDRPFKSVEDVLQVKGMGEKLLGKIRSQLTV